MRTLELQTRIEMQEAMLDERTQRANALIRERDELMRTLAAYRASRRTDEVV